MPAVQMQQARALSSHISVGLTPFWIILATVNELPSRRLGKHPVGQALFWKWGYKQKWDVVPAPKELQPVAAFPGLAV